MIGAADISRALSSGSGCTLENVVAVTSSLAVAEVFINPGENVERSSSVTAILGNEEFKNKISTIDNAETEIGALAVVLALGDLKNGVVNHLGVGEGSQRLLPVWWRL
jgi:hypothetical protein